jgi:4-alpha-glucanotransferase
MSAATLESLARAAGLALQWRDYRGRQQQVAADTLRHILAALELPADSAEQIEDSSRRLQQETSGETEPLLRILDAGSRLPLHIGNAGDRSAQARLIAENGASIELKLEWDGDGRSLLPPIEAPGYYKLEVGAKQFSLAVAPARCYGTADAAGTERLWGISAQLYSLRQTGDGGIGNFSALAEFGRQAAKRGADAVAISPVHALFSADLNHFSPYSPSSRLFLNALYADPAGVFGAAAVAEAIDRNGLRAEQVRREQDQLIDWPAAAGAKLKLLRTLYQDCKSRLDEGSETLALDYRSFVLSGGAALRDHARFEALHAAALQRDPGQWHWRNWPAPLRDPSSVAVADFAREQAGEVDYHLFLQWLADRGLAGAQAQVRGAGMRIGLIADLAIGTDSGGSHAWSRQQDMLSGLSVGAPPDLLNLLGQNWGLTAFSPRGLKRHGYAPFIETLRAGLRHAGGLRIDHVLGLSRLWLVPDGAESKTGAYLSYPLQDMLRLVALESWRHRAVIIGEDLGTVPEGFREHLVRTGVLGIQVMWFERDHGYFIDPARWSPHSIATTTTHDLPTVAGWWRERDIDGLMEYGHLAPDSSEAAERDQRAQDRQTLWSAFGHAGVASQAMPAPDQPEPVIDAALAFIGRTPAPLALTPVEDLIGSMEQPNVPGTTDQHPNWRRRMPRDAETLLSTDDAERRIAILNGARRED